MISDYKVGYSKPPVKSRFKPGVSGNPKGRPKRKTVALAEIIEAALNAPIGYPIDDRIKVTTRLELSLKALIDRATTGNLTAAGLVLTVREHAQRFGDVGVNRLQISDWLPDYPGQSGDQKTLDFADKTEASPLEWWGSQEKSPGDQTEG
jgi:Family of unknown function (DUF5681)